MKNQLVGHGAEFIDISRIDQERLGRLVNNIELSKGRIS